MLHIFHFSLAVIHGIAAIFQIITDTKFNAPFGLYNKDGFILLFNLKLNYFVAILLALAAVDHFYIYVNFEQYEDDIANERHIESRWLEYSITVPIINVVIGSECGIKDIALLLVIAFMSVLMIQMGLRIEMYPYLDTSFFMSTAWCLFFMIWAVLLDYFIINAAGAPDFVYAIVFVLLILESLFGITQLCLNKKVIQREWAYALLSLGAKQSLAWITWGGLRSRD
jgi:hypothetical protein